MARVTVEDCLDKIDNRFLLVHIAVRRCKSLLKGAKPMIKSKENKQIVCALREIAEGRIFPARRVNLDYIEI